MSLGTMQTRVVAITSHFLLSFLSTSQIIIAVFFLVLLRHRIRCCVFHIVGVGMYLMVTRI